MKPMNVFNVPQLDNRGLYLATIGSIKLHHLETANGVPAI
jgi:hypothetical protein